MKRYVAVEGFKCLEQMLKSSQNVKFNLKVIKNKQMLEKENELFEELRAPSEELLAYEKDVQLAAVQNCDKDEEGKPIEKEKGMLTFSGENKEVFEKELREIEEKHNFKELSEVEAKKKQDLQEVLLEEVDYELIKFTADELEENSITDGLFLEILSKCDLIEM